MKKICWIMLLSVLLCGCAAEETFETLGDVNAVPAVKEEQDLVVSIPDPAEIMQGASGTLYLCQDYTLSVEVFSAGDLNSTMKNLTGFGTDDLTVITTASGDYSRYECVWTAAGEGGDWVGRTLVLDDGAWHYCVTMQYCAADASGMQDTWQEIIGSVRVG